MLYTVASQLMFDMIDGRMARALRDKRIGNGLRDP
jgi:hypothetical protein